MKTDCLPPELLAAIPDIDPRTVKVDWVSPNHAVVYYYTSAGPGVREVWIDG